MINLLQKPNKLTSPKKKFRGKRRYFKNVIKKANEFDLTVDKDSWWDFWHYHADWPGYGNLAWRYRLEHLKALCIVYDIAANQLTNYVNPFQLFFVLDVMDAGQDGVFIFSPNPNNNHFPFKNSKIEWGNERITLLFRDLLPKYRFKVGVLDSEVIYIYSPDVGVSIE